MTDRAKIPYEHPTTRNNPTSDAKRWTRKLAEAGKLTSPGKRVPHYGRMTEEKPQ